MTNDEAVWIKALLLEEASIKISPLISTREQTQYFSAENLYNSSQVFIKLNRSVKVCLSTSDKSKYMISEDMDSIIEIKNGRTMIDGIKIVALTSSLLHSPQQALFNLYKRCSRNCAFCPISFQKDNIEFMNADLFSKIIPQLKDIDLHGIGFTTGIPEGWSEEKMVAEITAVIKTIKKCRGQNAYISAAPPPLKKSNIDKLKVSGLNEIRINIEAYNPKIFRMMCPDFVYEDNIRAILDSVQIFGRNKVSTNMIIGLGESDEDILKGVRFFARHGVFTTLSPLDVVPERKEHLRSLMGREPVRPAAKRLYDLAIKQKKIYDLYGITLNNGLRTMCSACGYCNIAPLIDL